MSKPAKKAKVKKDQPTIHRSNKLPNTNLYAAIVSGGGDKRVAAMASHKYSTVHPSQDRALVNRLAKEVYDGDRYETAVVQQDKRKNAPKKRGRPKK